MIFDVITIFPGFFKSILECGLLKRAIESGKISIRLRDLRDFTGDVHRTVDDRPFGGGPGMVFKPEPLFRAVEAIQADSSLPAIRVIVLSPQGRRFDQDLARELSSEPQLALISSRYEGVDERVVRHLATDEVSIGDYVLSGGELPAAVLMESITRLLPGVLGNDESAEADSFAAQRGEGNAPLLDYPQYTRPADFRGFKVPEVLLSGNHHEIAEWRRKQALLKTIERWPDLKRAKK